MSKQEAERSVASRTALLEQALQRARASQAEFLDAKANVSDLRFLRLDALADGMAKITRGQTNLDVFMTLKAIPGDPPRLIVDASSHVVMEPDPRTYMLIYDGPEERKVLCETESQREIEEKLTEYVAHRIVAQERATGDALEKPETPQKNNRLNYFLVWSIGVMMGVLALFAYSHARTHSVLEIFQALTSG
ncbi:MAG: hypothetical protein GY948_07605 [Alphaproteobacteria bacterium]|nr:hypothetical protein [Alphaproteobacteria bacterium]